MAITPITLADLTATPGTAVFDTLMAAVRTNIDEEFKAGRIKGAEFSQVYLAALETTMRTAMEFLLQRQRNLLESQLLEQQVLKTQVEVQVLEQQKLNAEQEFLVLGAQILKLNVEKDILLATQDKTEQEVLLLTQKVLTERAQVEGAIADATSVIGRQNDLYAAQTEGFTRDAEQKAADIMVGVWNVLRTTGGAGVSNDPDNGLQDANIKKAVQQLLIGAGITPA